MKHLDDIAALIKTLQKSTLFHALVIQSAPGYAKSSTVEKILKELAIDFEAIGSYTTPLQIFSALGSAPNKTLVFDDAAGVFGNPIAMSLLKAATWESVGSSRVRTVTWRSSSEKVETGQIMFGGKLILLTNAVPANSDVQAFLSRTLYLHLQFGPEEVGAMLKEAATKTEYYPNTAMALEVADHLIASLSKRDSERINLRTLQLGYELIQANPETWKELLDRLLPKTDPHFIAEKILQSASGPEDQARQFTRLTGLSRRTFFNYRKEMESRPRQAAAGDGPQSPINSKIAFYP